MAVQIYLVHPKDNNDERAREIIAEYIAACQGFILMASSYGSLIVAFDEQYLGAVKSHHLVEFAGGVTLDPNAPAAAAIRQLFAQNVAAQLVSRGGAMAGDSAQNTFPPGYRPLRWPVRDEDGSV